MKRTRAAAAATLLLTLVLARAVLATKPAAAEGGASGRARVEAATRANGIPAFARRLPNGASRTIMNISGHTHLAAMEQALGKGSNVLEILSSGAPGAFHTMAIFDRQLVHTQYAQGTSNWRLRSWGNALRPSSSKLYSAMIQLTPEEGTRLRSFLEAGWKEQGPEHLAGNQWERGNLKGGLGGIRCINCVSSWTEMPVGEGSQPLWRVVGLPSSFSGNPQGLQRALETNTNDRVFGVAVYGPTLPAFGAKPDEPVTNF